MRGRPPSFSETASPIAHAADDARDHAVHLARAVGREEPQRDCAVELIGVARDEILGVDLGRRVELVVPHGIALAERLVAESVDGARRGVHEAAGAGARTRVEQPERRERVDAVELACALGEADVRLGEVHDRLDLGQRLTLDGGAEIALHGRDP